VGYHSEIPKPFTVPSLAQRWGCSEGLIRKMIDRGELRSFRLGVLIRVPVEEVERVECQNLTASSDFSEGSPSSGSRMESAGESGSTRRIVRAPKLKRVLRGRQPTQEHGR